MFYSYNETKLNGHISKTDTSICKDLANIPYAVDQGTVLTSTGAGDGNPAALFKRRVVLNRCHSIRLFIEFTHT